MPLRNNVEQIYQKKYQLSIVFSLVNILTIPFNPKHVTHSLDTHGVPTNRSSDVKVSMSAFDLWKVPGHIWFIVFLLNRLVLVNHFQMYFVLFTVNSYTLMSCCHGPVARQTCLTSRCEVTIRQRLTCFLFQWSHCTVNICNGNTPGKMQYRLTGVKLQPSRDEDATLKTDQGFCSIWRQISVVVLWTAMHIGQESAKWVKLSSQHTVNLIRLFGKLSDRRWVNMLYIALCFGWGLLRYSVMKRASLPLWNKWHRKFCIVWLMLDSNPTLTQWCQSFRLKSSIPCHWLSTQWTGEASLGLGEKTVSAVMWWGNPQSA